MSDAVNHPKHYNTGKIEVIEFLEDQNLGLHLGNVVKYVCRAGRKDKATRIQDLEKAAWYLARKLELLKAKRDKRVVKRPNDMGSRPFPEHPNCRCFAEPISHKVPGNKPECSINISAKGIEVKGELTEDLAFLKPWLVRK